jgi:hypothetical protein
MDMSIIPQTDITILVWSSCITVGNSCLFTIEGVLGNRNDIIRIHIVVGDLHNVHIIQKSFSRMDNTLLHHLMTNTCSKFLD